MGKEPSQDSIDTMKNACHYYMSTSNLSIKELETARQDKSHSDKFENDSTKFYSHDLDGATEILHIDLTKMPNMKE